MTTHYDVLVIGSGFGGSVSALRLTEKGYTVGVLEAGARFADDELPEHGGDVKKFLFRPEVGLYGIQRIDIVHDCFILAGAGVGGGSLNYANTLYEPPEPFYQDRQWSHITDWKSELAPYFDQAKRMLGVTTYARTTPADVAMKKVADEMGVGHTFVPTPVGVFFGEPGQAEGETVPDPFFGGAGPERSTCINCGSCMTGCRHNAKNTLVKNYLHLAEGNGAVVHPLTTVTDVRPRAEGGYEVTARWTKAKLSRRRRSGPSPPTTSSSRPPRSARSACCTGSRPRARCRDLRPARGPHAHQLRSHPLGHRQRRRRRLDGGRRDHLELPPRRAHARRARPLRPRSQRDAADGHRARRRGARREAVAHLGQGALAPARRTARPLLARHVVASHVVALVMQTLDNSITTVWRKRGGFGYLSSTQGHGAPNPTYIASAYDAVRRLARIMGARRAYGAIGEPLGMPLTAHFIGGCAIGDSSATGVVDPYQRLYGYDGLHVVDGSTVSANLGVNPSLTITAQAERAMAFWPNKGEADPRPELGATYRRLAPVEPKNPAVPEAAPGALRLPIVGVS